MAVNPANSPNIPLTEVAAGGGASTNSDKIVVPAGGCYYAIWDTALQNTNGDDTLNLSVDRNGSITNTPVAEHMYPTNWDGSQYIPLQAGDTVSLRYTYQYGGHVWGTGAHLTLIRSGDAC
jgi:hypothetical protein